jgi:hypothetical protein
MGRLLDNGVYDPTFSVALNSTLYTSCFTVDNKVMIGGTLTLFLVLQNIGLPESNYVQIALFGMVLSGTMGFHPVIKQLFSMIIWQVLLPMMLVPA